MIARRGLPGAALLAGGLLAAVAFVAACSTSPTPYTTSSPEPSLSATPTPIALPASPSATPSASAPEASSTPGPPPASDFVATVDNPWFPLIPGTTLTYKGTKDGEAAVDTFAISADTKVVAGVTCVVINDTLKLGGVLAEKTEDWYAQDRSGNVWYFGEQTAEYDESGAVTSTEGSWQAGVKGASAGIYMPGDPQVGQSFAQEYFAGQAEDHFVVLLVGTPVKVPYGSFAGALLTAEWTPLEPDVLSEKFYAKDIGELKEFDVAGGDESLQLVTVKKP